MVARCQLAPTPDARSLAHGDQIPNGIFIVPVAGDRLNFAEFYNFLKGQKAAEAVLRKLETPA